LHLPYGRSDIVESAAAVLRFDGAPIILYFVDFRLMREADRVGGVGARGLRFHTFPSVCPIRVIPICNAFAGRASYPSWEPDIALGGAASAVRREHRAGLGRRPGRGSQAMRRQGVSREMRRTVGCAQ